MRPATALGAAAERAAAEVYEIVRRAAQEAAEQAVRDAIRNQLGLDLDDVQLEDRMTRSEAARQLGTTSQTIMRLEEKGLVRTEHVGGRVYVSKSEVEDALRGAPRALQTRASMQR